MIRFSGQQQSGRASRTAPTGDARRQAAKLCQTWPRPKAGRFARPHMLRQTPPNAPRQGAAQPLSIGNDQPQMLSIENMGDPADKRPAGLSPSNIFAKRRILGSIPIAIRPGLRPGRSAAGDGLRSQARSGRRRQRKEMRPKRATWSRGRANRPPAVYR